MYKDQKVIVVLPAYNAAKTLEKTFHEIPHTLVDEIILCDDASGDDTLEIASKLGIQHVIAHPRNMGYGANQKTLYNKALELGGDIIIMLHPDYQYTPKLIPAMIHIIGEKIYPVVLGSRILGKGALPGGMPRYKYVANRILTLFQNFILNYKLSEYHTGYRAFHRSVLESIPYQKNSDNFVFDNEVLAQIIFYRFHIAEVTCPTRYFSDASSINFTKSILYGLGVLRVSMVFRLCRWGLWKSSIFPVKK